jgi:hypothetical protein
MRCYQVVVVAVLDALLSAPLTHRLEGQGGPKPHRTSLHQPPLHQRRIGVRPPERLPNALQWVHENTTTAGGAMSTSGYDGRH